MSLSSWQNASKHSMMSFLGRVRLRTYIQPIRHFQQLDLARRQGLVAIASIPRSLHVTVTSPPRPTTSTLGAPTMFPFLRRVLGYKRKSKSTNPGLEPQPEHGGSPRRFILPDCRPDDPKLAEAYNRNWEREAAENSSEFQDFLRDSELFMPLWFFWTNFPEEDGFFYKWLVNSVTTLSKDQLHQERRRG
ncbi:hypothetical protein N658DRAFT_72196 [Parathielavia hyrcaniae]|uniref:Uncharacterized protein n=1 Tax=Parathielavia hyrcaniae TaxID=113614 RepID=A0AAN6SWV1_9PEZI|nr:hypothetical protein N658DRAFT_72196 [Parathielavia hyrcaniae]